LLEPAPFKEKGKINALLTLAGTGQYNEAPVMARNLWKDPY
jgi:hypothetical protein